MKYLFTIVTVLFIFTVTASAQKTKYNFNNDNINNLLIGIRSGNYGLQQSCIYFAGKYKIEETLEVLKKILSENENEKIKTLAALSISEIGSRNGIKFIRSLINNEKNIRLKKLYYSISSEYKW